MTTSRRTVLRNSAAGAGALAAVSSGVFSTPARAQSATPTTLVFLSKRLDASTADYRKWYNEHHAPDFLSFGRPYLRRYAQDFVEANGNNVDFDCISEFQYRSAESRDTLLKLTATPEAMKVLASHPKVGSQPGPNEDHSGSRTFSVEEQVLSGPPRGYDPPGTKKWAVLFRDKGSPSPKAFVDGVKEFGSRFGTGAARVILNLAVPEAGRPAPLFDAVVQIWPANGEWPGSMPIEIITPPWFDISGFINLISYEAKLNAL